MREIKFRGKRIDTGEWVYGDLLQDGDLSFIVGSLKEFMDTPVNECLVNPETVGQYTGLKVSNGKEIYEGDIFQVKAYEPKYEIYFNNGVFEYRQIGSSNRPFLLRRIYFDSYIIGNIHDNPELLEDEL